MTLDIIMFKLANDTSSENEYYIIGHKIGLAACVSCDQKLPKIGATFTNLEVWSSKTELPKIEINNIKHR